MMTSSTVRQNKRCLRQARRLPRTSSENSASVMHAPRSSLICSRSAVSSVRQTAPSRATSSAQAMRTSLRENPKANPRRNAYNIFVKRLILFDVDGTLVNCPPDTARVAAIRDLYGLEVSLEGLRTGGMTEPQILTLLLQSAGWDDSKIKAELPNLMNKVASCIPETFRKGSVELLPGVKQVLDELENRDIALGLVTGNHKSLRSEEHTSELQSH